MIGVPILGKSLGGLDALLSAVQMPPGHPGRLRRDRRRQKRRGARRADNQRMAADLIVRINVIPRYTRPEIGAVWTQQRKMEMLARGRAGGDRGLGGGGRRPARRPPRLRGRTPPSRSRRSTSARGSPTTTSPPSSTSSPPRSASTAAGSTTASPPPTCSTRRWPCSCARRARSSSPAPAPTATRWSSGRWSTRDTLCVGRTHGVHAEPTTFGLRLAGFAFEADRNLQPARRRLRAARLRQALRRGRHLRLGARPRSRRG